MEFRQYIRILAQSWWIILSITLVGLVGSLVFSFLATPIYEANATYVARLQLVEGAEPGDVIFGMDTLAGRQNIFFTYCEVMVSRQVLEEARLAISLPEEALEKYKIKCVNLPSTNVIAVSVQGPSEIVAESLSRSIGVAGIEESNRLYSFFPLQELDPTLLEPNPVSPVLIQNVFLGTVFGLMVSVGVALLLDYFSGPSRWIEEQSIRDPYLGVYNARYFRKRVDEERQRAYARNRPITFAAILAKPTEDFELYSEQVRYSLLRKVATLIEDNLQYGSIVSYLAPNLFGVLLAETSGDVGLGIIEKVYDDIRTHRFEAEKHVTSFQSVIGLVTSSASDVSYNEVLSNLNEALKIAEDSPRSIHLIRLTPPPFSEDQILAADTGPTGDVFSDFSFLDGESVPAISDGSVFDDDETSSAFVMETPAAKSETSPEEQSTAQSTEDQPTADDEQADDEPNEDSNIDNLLDGLGQFLVEEEEQEEDDA